MEEKSTRFNPDEFKTPILDREEDNDKTIRIDSPEAVRKLASKPADGKVRKVKKKGGIKWR